MDEIWGFVSTILEGGELLLEVTEVADDNDEAYEELERVRAAAMVEAGDFVHVFVRERDAAGALLGEVTLEEEEEEEEETEEAGGPGFEPWEEEEEEEDERQAW